MSRSVATRSPLSVLLILVGGCALGGCGKTSSGPAPERTQDLLPRLAVVREAPEGDPVGIGEFHAEGAFEAVGRAAAAAGKAVRLEPGQELVAESWVSRGAKVELELGAEQASSCSLIVETLDGDEELDRELEATPSGSGHSIDLAGWDAGRYRFRLANAEGAPRAEVRSFEITTSQRGTNVILIVVDTLRGDHVMDHNGRILLPEIGRLAEDGVAFPRAFVHAPTTLPSHTSLFSSRYPYIHGVLDNYVSVDGSVPLLAETMRDAGYATGAVISMRVLWNGVRNASVDRGFDLYRYGERPLTYADQSIEVLLTEMDALSLREPMFVFAHFFDPHEPYSAHGTVVHKVKVELNGELIEEVVTSDSSFWEKTVTWAPGRNLVRMTSDHPFKQRRTKARVGGKSVEVEWVEGTHLKPTTRSVVAIENPSDEPVTGVFELFSTDIPTMEERRNRYRLEAEFVDGHIGRFLDRLVDLGLYDDSLIVFTSDHGESLGEHKHVGHVQTLYDTVLHVPLVIKPPKGHESLASLRAQKDILVRNVDIAPTILHILDMPPIDGQQGLSIMEQQGSRLLHAETHPKQAKRLFYSLRDDEYKIIYAPDEDEFQMFNIRTDPGELLNIFEESSDERAKWVTDLKKLAKKAPRSAAEVDLSPERIDDLNAVGYLDE